MRAIQPDDPTREFTSAHQCRVFTGLSNHRSFLAPNDKRQRSIRWQSIISNLEKRVRRSHESRQSAEMYLQPPTLSSTNLCNRTPAPHLPAQVSGSCRFDVVCSRCATSCEETPTTVNVLDNTSVPTCQPVCAFHNEIGILQAVLNIGWMREDVGHVGVRKNPLFAVG